MEAVGKPPQQMLLGGEQVVQLADSREAAMVMTTAAVHSGASGGAVLLPDGRLGALATSNTKQASSGAIMPRLNFSIPASLLRPVFELANSARGDSAAAADWAALEPAPAALQQAWMLGHPPAGERDAGGPRAPAGLTALLDSRARPRL